MRTLLGVVAALFIFVGNTLANGIPGRTRSDYGQAGFHILLRLPHTAQASRLLLFEQGRTQQFYKNQFFPFFRAAAGGAPPSVFPPSPRHNCRSHHSHHQHPGAGQPVAACRGTVWTRHLAAPPNPQLTIWIFMSVRYAKFGICNSARRFVSADLSPSSQAPRLCARSTQIPQTWVPIAA